ncbi:MAG TPA: HypC/HybG/HupF family hydrogenase formation chaperone [Syntrophales bacterium]|nr:HypC/HybG/HupF family hydrogenase formation chaperone [Syntrophales bacterium]
MCIAFPGKIVSIDENNVAVIDISGMRREASLDLVGQEVRVGDYVICHAGFAIHRLDEEAAEESLALLRELIDREIY